jgi:hypothetical protein
MEAAMARQKPRSCARLSQRILPEESCGEPPMTTHRPLTEENRALLVSGQLTTQLSIRQLGEHFKTTAAVIKRCQRQIRAGKSNVYLISPPHVRKKIPYRYCADIVSPHREAEESPFGMDPVVACENHLVDLKRWHKPWTSPPRHTMFEPRRMRAR